MKKIVILSIVFAFALSASAFALPAGDVKWNNLKDGMAKAKAEKKPLIVDFFYSKDCPRCARLEQHIYSDPKIAKEINDDFVPVFIDLTKPLSKEEEDLGDKYDYKNDCLMLFRLVSCRGFFCSANSPKGILAAYIGLQAVGCRL